MNKTILSSFSIPALAIMTGCGGAVDVVSTSDDTGSAPAAPATGNTGAPRTGALVMPPTVSVSGFVHAADGSALGGVKVCLQAGPTIVMDIGNCVTSGGDGSWTLQDVPQNLLVTIGLEKAGFVPIIRAIQTEANDLTIPTDENRLIPLDEATNFAGSPANTGSVEFFVGPDGENAAPASVQLISVDSGSWSPTYLGADGKLVPGATEGARGVFEGVPMGLYFLTFTNRSATCTPKGMLYGYPIDYPGLPTIATLVVPVAYGHVTTPVGVECTGTAPPVAP